jgi:Mrp family chromosome partitioning ATPase
VLGATGVPPLGRVRHAKQWGWRRSLLVMHDGERSLVAEAFRSLRASIQLTAPHRALRVLVITSAGPGEGKTFVASNLAISLAQAGKRVLLVDADVRRPAVHRVFGVSNALGLVDALRQSDQPAGVGSAGSPNFSAAPLGDPRIVHGVVASTVDNLWLLPAGTPPRNPAELLSSEAVGQLVEQLRHHWDVLVLDTAPVSAVADTLLLARHSDGCLLVARCGRTRRAALGGAIAALRGVGQPLVGVVLNDERPGPLARFSRDDYYYQHGYWSEIPSAGITEGVDGWQSGLGLPHAGEPGVADPGTLHGAGGHAPEQPTR